MFSKWLLMVLQSNTWPKSALGRTDRKAAWNEQLPTSKQWWSVKASSGNSISTLSLLRVDRWSTELRLPLNKLDSKEIKDPGHHSTVIFLLGNRVIFHEKWMSCYVFVLLDLLLLCVCTRWYTVWIRYTCHCRHVEVRRQVLGMRQFSPSSVGSRG